MYLEFNSEILSKLDKHGFTYGVLISMQDEEIQKEHEEIDLFELKVFKGRKEAEIYIAENDIFKTTYYELREDGYELADGIDGMHISINSDFANAENES